MATETNWDAGATTWDRDWDGPGTRTIWDAVPEIISRTVRVVWQPIARRVAWLSPRRRVRW